jgi:hypothetical protein
MDEVRPRPYGDMFHTRAMRRRPWDGRGRAEVTSLPKCVRLSRYNPRPRPPKKPNGTDGRFGFAESKSDPGNLTVLAINMQNNTKAGPAGRHDSFLAIPERNVDLGVADRDDFDPTFRIMANDEPRDTGQHLWPIVGCQIDVPGDGGFKWDSPTAVRVADFAELSSSKLDKTKYVDSYPNLTTTTAVIRLHSGRGAAYQMTSKTFDYDYVRFDDSGRPVKEAGLLADMVEVRAELPNNRLDLSLERVGKKPSHVRVSRKAGLPAGTPSSIVLSFSNLCTKSHTGRADEEFAAFYAVLVDPPPVGERLIPRTKKTFR